MGEAVGKPGDAESCDGGGNERRAVVGLEAPARVNRDDLVAIQPPFAGQGSSMVSISDEISIRASLHPCITLMRCSSLLADDDARTVSVRRLADTVWEE